MPNGRSYEKRTAYRIRLKGRLDPAWSDWFDGFTIMSLEDETLLIGTVPDQAALLGILTKINDLGLTLITMNEATEEKGTNQKGS